MKRIRKNKGIWSRIAGINICCRSCVPSMLSNTSNVISPVQMPNMFD